MQSVSSMRNQEHVLFIKRYCVLIECRLGSCIFNSLHYVNTICVNPSETGDCNERFYNRLFITYLLCYRGNISSRFSGNSEADAPELPENLEEMFPRYYIDGEVISKFKSSTTNYAMKRMNEKINVEDNHKFLW